MKRAHQALAFSAAIGAGLLAASAFAQQSAAPTPATPPAQTQAAQQQPNATTPRRARGMSNEDRSAFFDARIAAIHAGLKLTPDQERLWPPVETAVRDMSRQMLALREQRQSQAAPADLVERMARMGDAATKRGQAMSKLAEAARPLYASLSDDQKRRLQTLMRQSGGDREGRGMMGRNDERGRHGRHHAMMSHNGWGHDHGDMRGMRDSNDRGGHWNDWR